MRKVYFLSIILFLGSCKKEDVKSCQINHTSQIRFLNSDKFDQLAVLKGSDLICILEPLEVSEFTEIPSGQTIYDFKKYNGSTITDQFSRKFTLSDCDKLTADIK